MNNEQQQVFPQIITPRFNLRNPKSDNPTIVYMVIRIGTKQLKISTGTKVSPSQWNKKKQRAFVSPHLTELDNMNNYIVNNKIQSFLFLFREIIEYLCTNPNDIIRIEALIKEKLQKNNKMGKRKSNALIDMLGLIAKREDRHIITNGTANGYIATVNKMETFVREKYDRQILYWDEVTADLLNDFEVWLHNQKTKHKITKENVYVEDNVVIGHLKKLSAILHFAEEDELIELPKKVEKFFSQKRKRDTTENNQVTISKDDLVAIMALPLDSRMEQSRDLFCFQAMVGQRYEDINGREVFPEGNTFKVRQKKGGKHIDIPLTDEVKKIIEKYDNKLPKIRVTAINADLKQIAKLAGLHGVCECTEMRNGKPYTYKVEKWQLVATHTARRTFVTDGIHDNMNENILRIITGHTSKSFDRYNRITRKEAANVYVREKNKQADKKGTDEVPTTPQTPMTYFNQNNDDLLKFYDEKKHKDEIQELKDVLVFLGARYIDLADIEDKDELCRLLYSKYERQLLDAGMEQRLIKNIYNITDLTLKEKRQRLLEVYRQMKNEIQANNLLPRKTSQDYEMCCYNVEATNAH